MNFCSFFYEIFSVPKHSSDQSHHLNCPQNRICSSIFNFSKNRKQKSIFLSLFKSNFDIQMQFLNFFFFLIVKSNFSIYIKIISKENIYLSFSTNSCRGLRKIFWIEKYIVSWSHFFDSFIQKQRIRCK